MLDSPIKHVYLREQAHVLTLSYGSGCQISAARLRRDTRSEYAIIYPTPIIAATGYWGYDVCLIDVENVNTKVIRYRKWVPISTESSHLGILDREGI